MKLFSKISPWWTIALAIPALCAGLTHSKHASAAAILLPANDFASVGLTSSQTLRVSVTSLAPVSPPYAKTIVFARTVQVTYYGPDGSQLQQTSITVPIGQTGTVDLDGATAAAAGRIQIRAEIRPLATPVEAGTKASTPVAFGQVTASEEVFDTATGQTTVLNPSPQSIVTGTVSATSG